MRQWAVIDYGLLYGELDGAASMEELIRSQKYDELAEYCEEEELKVHIYISYSYWNATVRIDRLKNV